MRKLKGTEKPNYCKNCIPCIRGKAKSTSHYKYDMMRRLKTEYKRCSAKTRLRVSSSKCKMLTSIKCYVKLQQHFSTKILYCYLNI